MTIQSAAQAKASQWIKEQRDSAESIQLRQETVTDHNTNDGHLTRSASPYTVRAKLSHYSNAEVIASQREGSNFPIQPEDLRAKLAVKDLGVSVKPAPNDKVVRADASEWTVVRASHDADYAFWTLQLRGP
jgi:hypothetical protein